MTTVESPAKSDEVLCPLTVTEHEQPLQHHLHLQPPASLGHASPVLSFERLREIEIPWDEVFRTVVTDSQRSSLTALKEYFQESWKLPKGSAPAAPSACVVEIAEGHPFFTVEFPSQGPAPAAAGSPAAAKPGQEQVVATAVPLTKGIVLRDGYGRHHFCKPVEGEKITKEDFLSPAPYAHLWKEKLQGVELCFDTKEHALSSYTRVEYVDLAEKFILDAYDQVRAHKDFDSDLQAELDSSTKEMIKGALNGGIDLEKLERIHQSITSLRLRKLEIQRRMERLAQRAAELGYFLALETKKNFIELPDKKARDIQAGQLYRQFEREYQWTTTIERVECEVRRGIRWLTSKFGIESSEPKRWQEKKTNSQVIVDVELVNVNDNALIKKIDRLTNEEHREVFVLDKTPNGYLTVEGTSLREIMFRCERDEAFRCRCAVLIPVIEKEFSGSQAVSGYHVFISPFPGIIPVALPKISILESLSYRLAWQETQLGEVVNSVNLAPGESRTITVRRSYEQETTYSQKRTTIFDLQESDTSDFASEMERELSTETQSGFNFGGRSGGKASAPIKGIKVEASGSQSFGYNKSIKSVNRTLTKVAQKASHAINRSYKDEVSTDTQQTTKISNYDEYVSTIKNINEGRTLNLLFYRLYNRYQAGLYVDDLLFRVTPSVEIIAGSGIHDSVAFDATELDRLLGEFDASRLPLDMDEVNAQRYLRLVVEEFDRLLDTEYRGPAFSFGDFKSWLYQYARHEEDARKAMEECKARGGSPVEVELARQTLLEKTRAHLEDRKRHLKERVESFKLMGNCIEEHDLQMLARGLYADAMVGAVPSTETYSERMREQMVALKMAEVEVTKADARYRETLAQHLLRNGGNCIVGVAPHSEDNAVRLTLKYPLSAGKWDFVLDGKTICEVPAEQLGNCAVNLRWDTHQKWLDDDGLLHRCWELHNRDKGLVVTRA